MVLIATLLPVAPFPKEPKAPAPSPVELPDNLRKAAVSSVCEVPDPDAGGYVCDTAPYSWAYMGGATSVALTDDSVSSAIALPFPFAWYGEAKATVQISSNGLLCFQAAGCTSYTPAAPPAPATPNDLLACFWEDLDPGAGGTVSYKFGGTAPERVLVVEFSAVPHYGKTSTNTFQLQLWEDGHANCMYSSVTNDADGKFTAAGTEDSLGTAGARYKYGEFAASQTGVRFDVQARRPVGSDGPSSWPSISSDGRYVAFSSTATNLVAGDTNLSSDIFVQDRSTGTNSRASVNSSGVQANSWSDRPSISADGRYISFYSLASNLVAGDTNGSLDVFVRDLANGTTTRASVNSSGAQATGSSDYSAISDDGRYVAFYSSAANLVVGDTNASADIFVRDLVGATTTRASVSSSGTQSNGYSDEPAISADGRYITFFSSASNLASGDTNAVSDIFIRDQSTGTTSIVSVTSSGLPANSSSSVSAVSSDGRYVAFDSYATNFDTFDRNGSVDVYLRDVVGGTTTWASAGSNGPTNGGSSRPSISNDGRYVGFSSSSALNWNDTNATSDVYEFDRLGCTFCAARLSFDDMHGQANGASYNPSMSGDGFHVAYASDASNLVELDANGLTDIRVHSWDAARTICTVSGRSDPPPGRDLTRGLEPYYPYRRWNLGTGSAYANMATGNLIAYFSDLQVPGQGFSFSATRSYNLDRDHIDGPLGKGWTFGLSDSLEATLGGEEGPDFDAALPDLAGLAEMAATRPVDAGGNSLGFTDVDGTRHSFTKDATGWHSPPGVDLTVSEAVDGQGRPGYDLVRPNGVRYQIRMTGTEYRLASLADRQGNATTIAYQPNSALSYWHQLPQSITDAKGRTLNFTWSGRYLTRMTFSAGGQSYVVDYNVDSVTRRLASVTEALGTSVARTTTFDYDAAGMLRAKDAKGVATAFSNRLGKLARLTDRAGNIWSFTYGGSTCAALTGVGSTAICLSDPEGRASNWTTSQPQGNLLQHRDPGDVDDTGAARPNDLRYEWVDNRVTKKIDEAGDTSDYVYNNRGQVTEFRFTGAGEVPVTTRIDYREIAPGVLELTDIRHASGTAEERHSSLAYNSNGSLASITDPEGGITSFGYYVRGLRKTTTDANGKTTTFGDAAMSDGGYDASGQPPKVTDPTGATRSFVYDFMGRTTQVTDAAGKLWRYEYDLRSNQTKATTPLGHSTLACYDANDNQTLAVRPKHAAPSCSLTENDAYVTRTTYDSRDLVSSVLTKSGAQLRKVVANYYDDGELKEVLGPRSFDASTGTQLAVLQKLSYLRYPNNRVSALIDAEGGRTDVVYTPDGLQRKVTDPPNSASGTRHSLTYTYTGQGSPKAVLESGHGAPTTYAHNLHDEPIAATTPKGTTSRFEYDRLGRLVEVVDAAGHPSTRRYDAVGNVLSLTQPTDVGASLTTSYTYSPRNEIASESDPADAAHTVAYAYDSVGRQRFRHDRYNGATERTVEQIWRDDGRLSRRVASFAATSSAKHDAAFDYDANGNVIAADTTVNGAASPNLSAISVGYTTADEPSTWTETLYPPTGAAVTKASSYTYAQDGLVASRTIDSNATTYDYYRNGLAKAATPWSSASSFSATYFASRALATLTLPNGVSVSHTYDAGGRPASKTARRSDATVLSSWDQIAYDDNDNRTADAATQVQIDGSVLAGSTANSYDLVERLVAAKHPFEAAPLAYVLDDASNIVADGSTTRTHHANRLTATTPVVPGNATSFSYDHFGNQSAKTTGTATTSSIYDAASFPRRITAPDGTWVEYAYDGLGRMVRRFESSGPTTLFFHDQASPNIALETDAAGTATTRYVLGSSGAALAADTSPGRGYYLSDLRANLTQITDQAQSVVATFAYDAYGNDRPNLTRAAPGWDSRLRYQMAPRDPKTGAYNIGPRIYDPTINRFSGADAFVSSTANMGLALNPLTANRYAYAGANPAMMTDDGNGPCPPFAHRTRKDGSHHCKGAGAMRVAGAAAKMAVQLAPGYDCVQFARRGGLGNAGFCALDVIPYVAKADEVLEVATKGRRTLRGVEEAAEGGANAVRLGQAGEDAVRGAYDIGPKFTTEINGRIRIFDGLSDEAVSEVKNVGYQAYTQQLKDSLAYAEQNGLYFDLYVRSGGGTRLSGPLADAIASNPLFRLRYIP